MAFKATRLAASALLALSLSMHSATAFSDSSTPVGAVPSSEQASPLQLFAKHIEIEGFGPTPIRRLVIDLPGRVFISYAANTSSDSADLLGKIKVSGSSEEVVGLFNVGYIGGTLSEVPVVLKLNAPARHGDALLVEVTLLRRNALKSVKKSGSCDLVLLDEVLYSSDKDPMVNDTNVLTSSVVELANTAGAGDVFVVDKAGSLVMDHANLLAGDGNLQFEFAALNASGGLYVTTGLAGNVSLFANALSADVDVSVGELKGAPRGSICLDSKTSNVNVTLYDKSPENLVSYPGKVTFPCAKRDIPARVPVGNGSASAADSPTKAVGTSAATRMRSALGLVIAMLLMAIM